MARHTFYTSSGKIVLRLNLDDAKCGSHQGDCGDDIDNLRLVKYISRQLDKIDEQELISELNGYGAWSDEELSDHSRNLDRILWIACGDIVENLNEESRWRKQ